MRRGAGGCFLSGFLFPHPVCGLAHEAGLRDEKTGLKGKASLQICVLVRVWWLVASDWTAAPELSRKGHMDNLCLGGSR